MNKIFAFWLITLCISFISGILIGSMDTKDCVEQKVEQKPETRTKTTTMREIVYRNTSGELFCPPCNKRRCVIVPPPQLFQEAVISTSCSDIEEELVDLQEKYEDIKKFCDPACPEYLERTSRELLSCMRDLHALTGSSRYDNSIYFP